MVIFYVVRNGGYLVIFIFLLVVVIFNYIGKIIIWCFYEMDLKSGKWKRVCNFYVDVGDVFLLNLGGYFVFVI